MSEIANRIGRRYDDILSYFRQHPFGSIPPDMTVLSVLPPVDRCIILERVFERGYGYGLVLADKLSTAYMKTGWLDFRKMFLRQCFNTGLIDECAYVEFIAKIENLSSFRLSAATYEDALCALPQYEIFGGDFCSLVRTLCEDYIDMNVFQGVDFLSPVWGPDVECFREERKSFIRRIGGAV